MAHHIHASGTGSTAAVFGHPLHPMLVGFPIGLFIGAFVADLTNLILGDAFWARGSFWLLVGGFAMGLLAAVPGFIDLLAIRHARSWGLAWAHGLLNFGVLTVALVNLLSRRTDMAGTVLPYGLLLSALTVTLLGVTGWLGGEMVFRHGIGVSRSVGNPGSQPDEYAGAPPFRPHADHDLRHGDEAT